jgi:hypothetical protein
MKAKPFQLIPSQGYVACAVEEATHLKFNFPGPTEYLILPVSRDGGKGWQWNGSLESPTLQPSILSRSTSFQCHSYITDGKVQFLGDCSHDLKGQTVDLLDVE